MTPLGLRRRPSPAPYLEPYLAAVACEGPTFGALLWRNRAGQEARFSALRALADPGGRHVADLGCGRADLLAHLVAHGAEPAAYIGVEAVPALAAASRARIDALGHPRARIVEADFAADAGVFAELRRQGADALLFSGSLNTFPPGAALEVLDRAWRELRAAPGGVLAFNFLNARHPDSPDRAGACFAFDPVGVLGWAFERTPLVAFRQDYLDGRDAAVAMFPPGADPRRGPPQAACP